MKIILFAIPAESHGVVICRTKSVAFRANPKVSDTAVAGHNALLNVRTAPPTILAQNPPRRTVLYGTLPLCARNSPMSLARGRRLPGGGRRVVPENRCSREPAEAGVATFV